MGGFAGEGQGGREVGGEGVAEGDGGEPGAAQRTEEKMVPASVAVASLIRGMLIQATSPSMVVLSMLLAATVALVSVVVSLVTERCSPCMPVR